MKEIDLFQKDITSTLGDLENFIESQKRKGLTSSAKIPLHYLIQSMYPNVPKNLEKNMREMYQQGFKDGYTEGVNNGESN